MVFSIHKCIRTQEFQAYIHHYRNWVQAFPSPFSSMDSWRIWRSAVRSRNSYLSIVRCLDFAKLHGHAQKRKTIPTRTKTSLWLVQITIKVKQGQEQRIPLWERDSFCKFVITGSSYKGSDSWHNTFILDVDASWFSSFRDYECNSSIHKRITLRWASHGLREGIKSDGSISQSFCSYGTKVEKIDQNQSFTTTDEGFLEKFRISHFRKRMDSFLYISEEGNR